MLLQQLLKAAAGRAQPRPQPYAPDLSAVAPAPGSRPPEPLPRDPALDAVAQVDELDAFMALSITDQLKRIEAELKLLPAEQIGVIMGVLKGDLKKKWLPLPGPQTMAYTSKADIILYGGAGGGGKSFLELGCAITQHKRSLILRRQSTELDGLVADSREIIGADGSYNSSPGVREWSLPNGASIKFGGCKEPDDWRAYAGRARDFIAFDEAAEFLEEQVASLVAWNRTTDPKQRCRVVLASNPPRGGDGQWIFKWFAPWLEPGHPTPAKPGELRWRVIVGTDVIWVDDPSFEEDGRPSEVTIDGEQYTPKSCTFVPAKLEDNPFLNRNSDYRATLQSLPEPLRSQLLKGDFGAGREDADWQVIPSAWVQSAQDRWQRRHEMRPGPPPGVSMTCLAVDASLGGKDETVLSARYGGWFAPLVTRKGIDTKDTALMAGLVFGTMRDACQIVVDMGGGWGGGVFGHLKEQQIPVEPFMGVSPSMRRTKDGKMGFLNLRADTIWSFREALDPANGSVIELPPDPQLAADLTAPRWKLIARDGGGVIQIESKAEIAKRLGRSTDRGDGVTMSHHYGGLHEMHARELREMRVTPVLGYANVKTAGRPQQAGRVNLGYRHGRR